MGAVWEETVKEPPLDLDWIALIVMARDMGYTKEDVRDFLRDLLANNALATERP